MRLKVVFDWAGTMVGHRLPLPCPATPWARARRAAARRGVGFAGAGWLVPRRAYFFFFKSSESEAAPVFCSKAPSFMSPR